VGLAGAVAGFCGTLRLRLGLRVRVCVCPCIDAHVGI
jgi:hypothetical protein